MNSPNARFSALPTSLPTLIPYLVLLLFTLTGLVLSPLAPGLTSLNRSKPNAVEIQGTADREIPAGLSEKAWDSIQESIQAARYQFTWNESRYAYTSNNQNQGFSSVLGVDSMKIYGPDWVVGFRLLSYGYNKALQSPTSPQVTAEGAIISFQWDDLLQEWYHNSAQGLEHGFEIGARPSGGKMEQPLVLELAVEGNLAAEQINDTVQFLDSTGQIVLRYAKLLVVDAMDRHIPARLELDEGESILRIFVQDSAAVYPLTVDPLFYTETTILHASDAQSSDHFATSVSVSGDTLVVGSPYESGGVGNPVPLAGAAYVFARNQGGADNWGEVAILRASDAQANDYFGYAVSISGDTVVVGAFNENGGAGNPAVASGSAYIFERDQGGVDDWGEVAILHASDKQFGDYFGVAVSISGDTVVVGAKTEDGGAGAGVNDDDGAAYVFERNQGGADNWGEVANLHASDAQIDDFFGTAVDISGDTIVVGAPGEDGGVGDLQANAGAAYVFNRNQGGADNWGEVAILHASDFQAGDLFGTAVAVSGDTLGIGAYQEDGGAGDPDAESGAAYLFERNQGGADNWGEVTILRASDAQEQDYFGFSLDMSSDTLVVGAYLEDAGDGDPTTNTGAAYVFNRNRGGADNWGESARLLASDRQDHDHFGYSVSISGGVLVVGAENEKGGGLGGPLPGSGAAYPFHDPLEKWGQVAKPLASDLQLEDEFGTAVALSMDTLVVGAPSEDGGSGDPLGESGAAYVFERDQGGSEVWEQAAVLYASDAQENDQFGVSVAIDNDTIVVGAYIEDGGAGDPAGDSGSAYVFERNQGGADNWGEVAVLRASDAQENDKFGRSVAISDDTIVIGAHEEDGGTGDPASAAGAAYVFGRNQGGADNWGEVIILHASDLQTLDFFGGSVAVSGDTVVVGASGEDGGNLDPVAESGAAYLFERNQGGADSWGEVLILRASDAQTQDFFGDSVSIFVDTIAVGAPQEDGGSGDPLGESGAAYIFERNQGGADSWGEVTILHASDAQMDDRFGISVAVWDSRLLVGANWEDGGAGDPAGNAGAVYAFERNLSGADNWGEEAILRAEDFQSTDEYGSVVSLYGDAAALGAPFEDGGPGNTKSEAGAAYLFRLVPEELFLPVVMK